MRKKSLGNTSVKTYLHTPLVRVRVEPKYGNTLERGNRRSLGEQNLFNDFYNNPKQHLIF